MTRTVPLYDLFGGAITLELPRGFLDASELRQVPDTQEVFLSPDSDLSVILEVLERVTDGRAGDDDEAALRFHFDSLAHDNSAQSSDVDHISAPASSPSSQSTPPPLRLRGTQRVAKFNSPASATDLVSIHMAVWRLRGVGNSGRGTDLVLTVNQPVALAGEDVSPDVGGQRRAAAQNVFDRAADTLRIVDWGLFA